MKPPTLPWKSLQDQPPRLVTVYLVGGWETPLKNMSSSVGIILPNIWKIRHVPKHQSVYIYIQYIYISHRMFPWWLVIHHHLRCRNIFRKTIFIRSLVNSHPFTNPLGGLRLDQPKSWIVIIHKLIINPPSFISSLLSPLFFHAWSPQWHSSNTQDIYIYISYI